MATYTYVISVSFPNGVLPSQLFDEIVAVISSPNLTNINDDGTNIQIIFDASLSNQTQLDTIVADHIPKIVSYVSPYLFDNIMKNTIEGVEYNYFGDQKDQITISTNTQSHYNSITAAIAANNVANNVFVVYPGTYVENNPINLPPSTTLMAAGSATSTFVVAMNPGSDLIVMNEKCKVAGLTLVGATGSGSRGIYFDGSLSGGQGKFSVINEIFVVDCNIGVESNGNNVAGIADTLYCDKLVIENNTIATSMGVYCHAGGQFITTTFYAVGVPGYFPINYGIYCVDSGSKVSLSTSSIWYCNYGLYLDNNGNAEISLLVLNTNNIGLYIGSTGSSTKIAANSLDFENSVTYDLDIQATSASIEIYSSHLDDSKLNNPNQINVAVKYVSFRYGSYYQSMLGDTEIGSPLEPSKLAVGEGLYINNGIVVFSNNNGTTGTWVDNTDSALNAVSSGFDIFPDGGVGNCCYVGSDVDIFGFKINILVATTSVVALEDLTWEFWNGSAWTTFYVMQTFPDYPMNTYVSGFVSMMGKFHIRFGLTTTAPFATLTLNGVTKKWVRIRVVNALPSVPTGEYVKIHTNNTLTNSDGFIEYFGNARPTQNHNIHAFYPSNSTVGNQEVFLTTTLSIAKPNNLLSYNTLSRIGFVFKMPIEIDTSFPIKLDFSFVGDNATAGNVYWTIRYQYTVAGNDMYLNSTDASSSPIVVLSSTHTTAIATNTNNQDLRDCIVLDVHTIPGNPSSSTKTILFVTLERDATVGNGNDTYLGDVAIYLMDITYVTWAIGGHILGF